MERTLLVEKCDPFDAGVFTNAINELIKKDTLLYPQSYGDDDEYLRDDVEALEPEFASSNKGSNEARITHHVSAKETMFGTVWLRTSTIKENPQHKTSKSPYIVTSFVYYPSLWLARFGLSYGVEASLSTCSKGWQFYVNPVRAVPDDSLIFEFARNGNLHGIKSLIQRGDASVQDTSSKGWTPLHVSILVSVLKLSVY